MSAKFLKVRINTDYKQRESIFLVLKECDSGKCFPNSAHFLTNRHGPQFYFTNRDSAGTFFSGAGGGGGGGAACDLLVRRHYAMSECMSVEIRMQTHSNYAKIRKV